MSSYHAIQGIYKFIIFKTEKYEEKNVKMSKYRKCIFTLYALNMVFSENVCIQCQSTSKKIMYRQSWPVSFYVYFLTFKLDESKHFQLIVSGVNEWKRK